MKDQRRPLGMYKSELCQHIKRGACKKGVACTYSHNTVEEFYHPDKYKAKFCDTYFDKSKECEYGNYCAFAHSE